ncbi:MULTISPECIES: hypothetical protein [Escherichia]|uniref:hypothetical protein n=1 Tax=Escherichia TaxID=561 RepID=UPI00061498B5|nr:hypothetical protein [Escherichia fergusonii]KWW08266.1 hypothetical protein VL22_0201380 [Escherichia fergusonii]
MSFKLSRSQFLQVFAVMQSIKLINEHTYNGAAPGIMWGSNNIDKAQFAQLIGLISETPLMQSLKSLPSGCTAPILINPFVEGGYIPDTGPGFIATHENEGLNIKSDAYFGAMDAHICMAFTNLIRFANKRADSLASPGDGFTGFLIERRDKKYSADKLQFIGKYGENAEIELQLPHVLANNSADSRLLMDIMRHFILESVKHVDDKAVAHNTESFDFATLQTATVVKSLETRLLENPVWGTW